jgi:hypothetical protein
VFNEKNKKYPPVKKKKRKSIRFELVNLRQKYVLQLVLLMFPLNADYFTNKYLRPLGFNKLKLESPWVDEEHLNEAT